MRIWHVMHLQTPAADGPMMLETMHGSIFRTSFGFDDQDRIWLLYGWNIFMATEVLGECTPTRPK